MTDLSGSMSMGMAGSPRRANLRPAPPPPADDATSTDGGDVLPGATSSIFYRIAKCHFTENDIYGSDIQSISVKNLYMNVLPRIKPSHNPRVLLICKGKLRSAALHVMFLRYGFISAACTDCDYAIRTHLRHGKCQFDVILVEWGLYPITGFDLTLYVRQKYKETVCVVGLVSGTTLAGDVIRGACDLFLRCPLILHLRMLRRLLLPRSMTNPKFPLKLMRKPANYELMQNVLFNTNGKKGGDISDIPLEAEPDPKINEKLLFTVIDYCRLHDPRNQDQRWKAMMLNIFDAMTNAKQALIVMAQEADELRKAANYCRIAHAMAPAPTATGGGGAGSEIDGWSRRELELQYLLVKDKLETQMEKIHDEVSALSRRDEDISNLLTDLLTKRDCGSKIDTPNSDLGLQLPSALSRHMTPEGKLLRERSMFSFCTNVSQRLEQQLMVHEDLLVTRHARKLFDPIVLKFAWPPLLARGNKAIYDNVRKMMDQVLRECNKLCIRVQGLAPAAAPRIREFEAGMILAIPPDPLEMFNPPDLGAAAKALAGKISKKAAPVPVALVIKTNRIDHLKMQILMDEARGRTATTMAKLTLRLVQFRYFTKWTQSAERRLLAAARVAETPSILGFHSLAASPTGRTSIDTHGLTSPPSTRIVVQGPTHPLNDNHQPPQQQQPRAIGGGGGGGPQHRAVSPALSDLDDVQSQRSSFSSKPAGALSPSAPPGSSSVKVSRGGGGVAQQQQQAPVSPTAPTAGAGGGGGGGAFSSAHLTAGPANGGANLRVQQPHTPLARSLGGGAMSPGPGGGLSPKAPGLGGVKDMLKQMMKDSNSAKPAAPIDGFVLTGGGGK